MPAASKDLRMYAEWCWDIQNRYPKLAYALQHANNVGIVKRSPNKRFDPPWERYAMWFPYDLAFTTLEKTLWKHDQGRVGLEEFPAGIYPSCSIHGALLSVDSSGILWRCAECNIGVRWFRDLTPAVRPESFRP